MANVFNVDDVVNDSIPFTHVVVASCEVLPYQT